MKNNTKRIALSSFIPALLYAFFLFTNPLYLSTDSQEVAVVVDGLYGSNNFCQFLHPLLCVIIKPLNALFPITDVFTTLLHLAVFFNFTLLLYLGFDGLPAFRKMILPDYIRIALVILSIAFLSAGVVIWNVNYNIQTAFYVFSGLLILTIAKLRGKRKIWFIFGTISVTFGYMLRIEAALLFVPFIALEIITELIEERRVPRYLLPTVLIIAVLFSSRVIFYHIEPYKSAIRYNVARTDCMDFPMKSWHKISDQDILQEDYLAATNWGLADTEIMTAELLEKAAEVGGENAFMLSDGLRPIFSEMWRELTKTNLYMFAMLIMTLILLLRNVIICPGLRKIESILAVLGGFIILFYFTVRGRAPMRVWEPVMFAADYVLISAAIRSGTGKRIDLLFQLLLCIGLWFSAGQVMAHNGWRAPMTTLNAKIGADDRVLIDTFDPEGIYLWPNWFLNVPWYFRDISKLPTKEALTHHLPVGDWLYGQPYFEEHLESIDMPNPGRALVENDHVYLMAGGDTFLQFLQAHYGEDLILKPVGEVNGKTAYRVVHSEITE